MSCEFSSSIRTSLERQWARHQLVLTRTVWAMGMRDFSKLQEKEDTSRN